MRAGSATVGRLLVYSGGFGGCWVCRGQADSAQTGFVPVIDISFEWTCVPGFSPPSSRSDPVAYSVQFGSTVGDESCFGRRPGGAKVTW